MATADIHAKALTPHVDRLWPTPSNLEGLFAAGEAVASMRASAGWQAVLAVLDAEVNGIEAQLDGRLLEHVEYASLHGRLYGLRCAREATTAIMDRASKRQVEQEQKHEAGAESPALEA